VRKGKGRPDITEVMFYSGYPSGSSSSLDSCKILREYFCSWMGMGRGWGAGAGWFTTRVVT
jgi:hypothetical protein